MSNLMKHRGYMSNAERNKNIKKLDRGNSGRKFVIATALIAAMVLGVYVLIGILAQVDVIKSTAINFVETTDDGFKFTAYGIIALVILGIDLIFGFLGFWFTITMISAKDASHRAIKLSKIALPGKKNSKSVGKDVRDRVTQR